MLLCYIYIHLYLNSDIAGDFLHLNLGNKERMKKAIKHSNPIRMTPMLKTNEKRENDHISSNRVPVIIGRWERKEKKNIYILADFAGCVVYLFLALRNWSSITPLEKEKNLFSFFFSTPIVDIILPFIPCLSFPLLFISHHIWNKNGGTGAMGTIFTRGNQNPIISPFFLSRNVTLFFMSP